LAAEEGLQIGVFTHVEHWGFHLVTVLRNLLRCDPSGQIHDEFEDLAQYEYLTAGDQYGVLTEHAQHFRVFRRKAH